MNHAEIDKHMCCSFWGSVAIIGEKMNGERLKKIL